MPLIKIFEHPWMLGHQEAYNLKFGITLTKKPREDPEPSSKRQSQPKFGQLNLDPSQNKLNSAKK
jgi:hypothetical protein